MQLFRGQSSSFDNPSLDIFIELAGAPYKPSSLAFEIWSTPEGGPDVQTYPIAGGQQPVDTDADELELGHYVALWDVPLTEPLNPHEIRWFIEGSATAYVETFDVGDVTEARAQFSKFYCTVDDCRGEGISLSVISDDRLLELIELASGEIDSLCRTWFTPRQRTLKLDGRAHAGLNLPAPPISISSVATLTGSEYDLDTIDLVEQSPREGTLFVDRPSLRLTYPSYGIFPKGRRNIVVTGVFGYTEEDGTALGRTPLAIKRATIMMVALMMEKIGLDIAGGGAGGIGGAPVSEIKTADQTVKYGISSSTGAGSGLNAPFTGNAALDMIIVRYRMQSMGAV